jgi:hypothetical protein
MGKPTDRIAADVDKRPCNEVYDRIVSEYWFGTYHGFRSRVLYGLDPASTLGRELCLRRWTTKSKKISIETKDQFKGRTGFSPDCFVEGTLILTPSGQVKIEDLRPGDEVVTPFGITRIAFIHDEVHNEICKVELSDGRVLEGKGKHRVFTWEDGWVRLDKLSGVYTLESEERLILWNILNSLFTTNKSIAFKQLVDIIRTTAGLRQRDFYTELSGSKTMGLFRKVCKSIISMAIGRITESRILHSLLHPITCGSTCASGSKTRTTMQKIWSLLNWPKKPQKNGTDQKKEESGTASMPTTAFSSARSLMEVANIVTSQSSPRTKANQSIVVEPVAKQPHATNIRRLFTLAKYVAKSLWLNRGISANVAPGVVASSKETRDARVLNLVLESQNVYYANGILVDNCADSFIYMIEMARRNGLTFIGNDKAVPTDRFWARPENKLQPDTEEDAYSSDDWGEDD